jgi:periplasmic divalent cation tolerance protein
MKHVMIFITVPSKKDGLRIAGRLVKGRFAACASLVPGLRSIYWWKGKVEKASEHLLILKTEFSMADKLIREAKKLHPYEVPEIIAAPIVKGNRDYLEWISGSIKGRR